MTATFFDCCYCCQYCDRAHPARCPRGCNGFIDQPLRDMPPGFQGFATVIMQPVPEGYECRWYKLPASLPPGTVTIPLGCLEYLYGGLYGKDRNLIRPLDE